MDSTLADFIRVLRTAGVRISLTESIDAHQALQRIGVADRLLMQHALGTTLAKTAEERELFNDCFERFFSHRGLGDRPETPQPLRGQAASMSGQPGRGSGAGGGSPGSGAATTAELTPLSRQLLEQDAERLAADIAAAGQRVGSHRIVSFLQRGRYIRQIAETLGLQGVDEDIARLSAAGAPQRELAGHLEGHREAWLERIRNHVDRQIALFADPQDRRLLQERLQRLELSQIDRQDYAEMRRLVRRIARRLATVHRRQHRLARRGELDLRRTLRRQLAYDGIPFEPQWRLVKKDRPRIMALCDVSGSVAAVSGFLLMFLYSVSDVLPRVRSFAFSDSLAEVTETFRTQVLDEAVATVLRQHGDRPSDYGRALGTFAARYLGEIDRRTTVIVLGDARSNDGDPGLESLRCVYRRAKQVIWLNPEARAQWGTGDSEMPRLATACHRVLVCNTLKHLERLVRDLMRLTT